MNFRLLILCALLGLSACASDGDPLPPQNPFQQQRERLRELKLEAGQLYKAARSSLDASDFANALSRYDQLVLNFPFSEYATQAELERIYALHRSFDQERALSNADKFLREHPRHPDTDYVQYLKGIINMDREDSFAGFLGLDTTKEDVSYSRRAFDDFALLAQKYPQSKFTADARQRMIFLRNRIAEHDLHVVRYYVKRGAHIAAAERAEQIVAQYPGAPSALEALRLMQKSYSALGLTQQADDAARLYSAQVAVLPPEEKPKPGFWASLFGG